MYFYINYYKLIKYNVFILKYLLNGMLQTKMMKMSRNLQETKNRMNGKKIRLERKRTSLKKIQRRKSMMTYSAQYGPSMVKKIPQMTLRKKVLREKVPEKKNQKKVFRKAKKKKKRKKMQRVTRLMKKSLLTLWNKKVLSLRANQSMMVCCIIFILIGVQQGSFFPSYKNETETF